MERFGDQLKRAREARGDSLELIAQKTRISRRYLEALEASDLDKLPGGAFDRGYIRSYVEVIGVDPAPYLAGYDEERERRGCGKQETEARLLDDFSRLVQQRTAGTRFDRSGKKRALALAAGFLLLSVSVWLVSRRNETTLSASPPPTVATQEREPDPRPGPEPDVVTTPSRTGPAAKALPRPLPQGSSAISVPNAGVGSGVVEHNLVGAGRRFAEGSTVVFWTRVVGASRGATIRHIWRYDGRVMMLSNLTIGSPDWRTFSRLVLPEGSSGSWEVEARDPDGKVLARERFVCLAASSGTIGVPDSGS